MRAKAATAWLPAVLYMVAIWVVSSLSSSSLQLDKLAISDKAAHFAEFAGLGLVTAHAVIRTWPMRSPTWTGIVACLFASMWGAVDELHQAWVPGRTPDGLDWVADLAGASCGVALRLGLARLPWFRKRSG